MADKRRLNLSGFAETLLIPLYYRALETGRPDALLRDEAAAAVIATLDCDFARFSASAHDQVLTILRARQIDRMTVDFLTSHPASVIVDIGCGLDTRFRRVDNGQVQWYNLDLPEVIALRRDLLQEPFSGRLNCVAGSAFDCGWLERLASTRPRPVLFVAEGVLPYFEESAVRRLILALKDHFPGSEIVFDALSPTLLRLHNLELIAARIKARLRWAVKDDRTLEGWGGGIHLREAWYYFDRPEPRLGWSNVFRHIPPLGRGARVLRYQLGENAAA